MIATADLVRAVEQALGYLKGQAEIEEAEVFAAVNGQLLARLNYTSHIPSNGVEEPKSTESYGLGLQVAFKGPDGPRIGFGAEPSDLTPAGVERALAKARRAAVRDPEFTSLPRPTGERRRLARYHDPRLLDLGDEELVGLGWREVSGALRTFIASSRLAELAGSEEGIRKLGLILGGDVTILQERVAIASTAMPEVQTDESTLVMAFLTAMVEARGAKGSGWSTGISLDHFTDEAGVEAAQRAVVLGPQPVTDLLNNIVIPSLTASSFYAQTTPFLGKWGKPIASQLLSLYDHGALPGFMGSKGITCEGLPTGRTDLIRNGVLAGLLTNWYEAQRLRRDPEGKAKLGVEPAAAGPGLIPRNGFRFGRGGGRHFDAQPGIAATNVIVEGAERSSLEELIAQVRDGLYIGRIWYTYPINGLRAGDFTATVVGDSWVIRDGRLAAPLKPNTVRINDNIATILNNVVGIGKDARGTLVWAADEVVYTPEVAVSGVRVDEIAGFMDALG